MRVSKQFIFWVDYPYKVKKKEYWDILKFMWFLKNKNCLSNEPDVSLQMLLNPNAPKSTKSLTEVHALSSCGLKENGELASVFEKRLLGWHLAAICVAV